MNSASVLIVGAGALGVATGYHLNLAGAQVDFLVRPNRMADLEHGQRLYCFDDHQIKEFTDYRSFASVSEAMATPHNFVIVTMDGATCRGEEATALLRQLGEAMQNSNAVAIISGVGVTDYCREVMGLPEERVIMGTMGLLSYQTNRVTLPHNPPTDEAKLASAAFGYRHIGNNPGFMVVGKTPGAKAFAELYNGSGVSKCAVMNQKLFDTFASTIFVTMAMFDLAGWPHADALARDTELMQLGSKAAKEVARLPQHGLAGKIAAFFMSPKQMAKTNAKMERDCLPVDYSAFNQFHHGGKVREQDIAVLRECLRTGQAKGRPMTALSQLVERYEKHIATSP